VLDSLADEAMATGYKNDVRHVVRGMGGRKGRERGKKRIGEGRGLIYGRISRATLHLAHYMKPAQNGQTLRERQCQSPKHLFHTALDKTKSRLFGVG
jgi:hypothetical protein